MPASLICRAANAQPGQAVALVDGRPAERAAEGSIVGKLQQVRHLVIPEVLLGDEPRLAAVRHAGRQQLIAVLSRPCRTGPEQLLARRAVVQVRIRGTARIQWIHAEQNRLTDRLDHNPLARQLDAAGRLVERLVRSPHVSRDQLPFAAVVTIQERSPQQWRSDRRERGTARGAKVDTHDEFSALQAFAHVAELDALRVADERLRTGRVNERLPEPRQEEEANSGDDQCADADSSGSPEDPAAEDLPREIVRGGRENLDLARHRPTRLWRSPPGCRAWFCNRRGCSGQASRPHRNPLLMPLGLAKDEDQSHGGERDKHIDEQQRAEQDRCIERRRDDDLQTAEHEQLPIVPDRLPLKQQDRLQIDQQVGDRQQLLFDRGMRELRKAAGRRHQCRPVGDQAIQANPPPQVGYEERRARSQ